VVSRVPLVAMLAANAISGAGNVITGLALPWFVLVTTDSAAKTGLVAFFGIVPSVLATFLGGPLIDRIGPKRISVVADVVSGLTVALVPLLYATGLLQFWHILTLAFLGSLLDSPGAAARDALLPDAAERAGMRLERANSISQVSNTTVTLLVPGLTGLLIATIGAANVLWLDAASFAVSALLYAVAVPVLRINRSNLEVGAAESGRLRRYLGELTEGLRFLVRQRLILSLFLVSIVSNFLTYPLYAVVLPVYVREVFGSALNLGLIISAGAVGALAGAAVYGAVGHKLPRRPVYISAWMVIATSLGVLALLPPLPVILAAEVLGGFFGAAINVIGPTIRQERTPAELRGRVFGATRAILMVAAPPGLLIVGYLLDRVGVQVILVAMATIQGLVALSLLFNPTLREMDISPAHAGHVSVHKRP
jgi:MFS family permease